MLVIAVVFLAAVLVCSSEVSSVEPIPRVFILMTVYKTVYNQRIWEMFLSNVDERKYTILIHSVGEIEPVLAFDYVKVRTVYSKYCNIVEPNRALMQAALSLSAHPGDAFIFASGDMLPIKNFDKMYSHFVNKNTSAFCVAPTDQWFHDNNNEYYVVKYHNWLSLTRSDVVKGLEARHKAGPNTDDLYLPYLKPTNVEGACREEAYWYTAIYGMYTKANPINNLVFPSKLEQGECILYVHWPDYPPGSVFLNNIPDLPFADQIIGKVHGHFYDKLRDSPNFYFARKIRSDDEKQSSNVMHKVEAQGKSEVLTLYEYFKLTDFYNH